MHPIFCLSGSADLSAVAVGKGRVGFAVVPVCGTIMETSIPLPSGVKMSTRFFRLLGAAVVLAALAVGFYTGTPDETTDSHDWGGARLAPIASFR